MYFSSISENLSFCWSTTLRAQKTKKGFNRTTWQENNNVIIIFASSANLPAKSSASCERQEAQNAPHVPAGFICSCVAFSSFRLRLLRFVFAICRRRRFGPFVVLFLRFLPLLHLCRHLSTLAPRWNRLHWKEVLTSPHKKRNCTKSSAELFVASRPITKNVSYTN